MNPPRRTLAPLFGLLVALVLSFSAGSVRAQLDDTPQALNASATTEMNAGNWEKALQFLTRCVELHDATAMSLWGPKFGSTWYRKGYCELKLKKYDAAIESFKTCYEKYPNDAAQAESGGNDYNKRALLYWGQAAQRAGQWEEAIRLYKKFIEERDKTRDKYHPGTYFINLAICNLKLGKIPEGIQHLETALKNKDRYKTPGAGIVAAFQALVDAVIEKRDEKALLGFIAANRADIVIEPYEMPGYNDLFLQLAARAYEADMKACAMVLYQLLPSSEVMLEDIRSRLERMGPRAVIREPGRQIARRTLESYRDALQSRISSGDPHEVVQLGATAVIHESGGFARGAFAAYEQLELFYSKSKRRESNLYNLVRTASIVGEVVATGKYGKRFLDTYPDSEHADAVRRLLLTSLFYGGEYEKCIEIATELLPQLEDGAPSQEHDICLHVLGGSYYYTGQFKEAQPLLDRHVETYPESDFALATAYFQASNLSRLQYWSKAARLLDAFLAKHPDPEENVYLPFALYDRANCHYAEDEMQPALEKLERIEKEFPDVEVIEMVYNLKGNVLQTQGKPEEAEENYLRALEIAERRGNHLVAGEALYYLVAMLGEKPKTEGDEGRLKDAVPYADQFWEKYGESSPYKAQVAVAEVYAFQAVGRGEEGLNRLRDVIAEMASIPGAVGLEEAINSYTDIYLENHTPDELKEHFYRFPKIKASDKVAQALLRIALIGVFEDQLEKAGDDPDKKSKAEAGIQVLFTDLRNDYKIEDLSPYILLRVGDFIRDTKSPREALPYYTELLERDDKSYLFPALFGRAAVLAKGSDADKAKALEDFQRVMTDSTSREDKDKALFETIATKMDMKNFAGARDDAKLYLDPDKGYSARKPEVGMMLGAAYEGLGGSENINAAIKAYLWCYSGNNMGRLWISIPAVRRYMELRWERNLTTEVKDQSDRQMAYNAGRDFVDQTERILGKATDDEQKAWKDLKELVLEYEAHPEVKSKAEQEKEKSR